MKIIWSPLAIAGVSEIDCAGQTNKNEGGCEYWDIEKRFLQKP